jgi:hypothetical protein
MTTYTVDTLLVNSYESFSISNRYLYLYLLKQEQIIPKNLANSCDEQRHLVFSK